MQARGGLPYLAYTGFVSPNRVWFSGSWVLNWVYNLTIERLEQGVFLDLSLKKGVNFGSVRSSCVTKFFKIIYSCSVSNLKKIFLWLQNKLNKYIFLILYCILYYLKRKYLLKQGIWATVLNRVMKNSLLS